MDKPISAESVETNKGATLYPEPFSTQVKGRIKKKLGDIFGLTNFGINLTQLEPGAVSALLHYHKAQDEFIFVLEGRPTLIVDEDEWELGPGDCMGFKAGTGKGHQLVNRSDGLVTYVEVGDRSPDDECEYPNDDIRAHFSSAGDWYFVHKDGTPY